MNERALGELGFLIDQLLALDNRVRMLRDGVPNDTRRRLLAEAAVYATEVSKTLARLLRIVEVVAEVDRDH